MWGSCFNGALEHEFAAAMTRTELKIDAGVATLSWVPRVLVLALAVALMASGARAESTAGAPSSQNTIKSQALGVPPVKNLLIMIRTTLIALSQANLTNNYSVLRDLGAPSFQEANSVARLSAAFADLRSRGGDIAPVVLALPTLSTPARIDQNGLLRLTGAFDTRPNQIAFDLAFQAVDGFWRLNGIAVNFRPAPAAASDQTPTGDKSPAEDASERHAPKKTSKTRKPPAN
jgi:hypothetical protein